MNMQIINQTSAIYEGEEFIITTFLIQQPDGMAVEYWYNMKGYGVMRMAYGGMVENEIKYDNSNLQPDLQYIADCIEWDKIEEER